ncbi:iron-sulfur cluster co-chaperone protein HscB-like [Anneissia japonica]|uniref:iron-sulfur cluster co-chaperone protein HscB-like n=1 Tax=Anneissia japonica TaxID=1529436 RepID=UPI00142580CA|nr:iron-sulfur cluster co-chaperone protein HscB-like [Anneissia japonica]
MAAPMFTMFRPLKSNLILGYRVLKCKHLLSQYVTINPNNRCSFGLFSTLYNCRSIDGEKNSGLGLAVCSGSIATKGPAQPRQHGLLAQNYIASFRPSHSLRQFPVRYCHLSLICWNCQSNLSSTDLGMNYFCDSCKIIQPCQENIDHFQRMNIPRSFDVNTSELTQTFRKFQRLLHPDKFSQKSPKEQEFSAAQSSSVNKAYSILLKPLNRGLYLLELLGYPIEEGDSMVDSAFLMDMMELNEKLSETSDLETVKKIGENNVQKMNKLLKELAELFKHDRLKEARDVLAKLKYFTNIDDKVKEKLGTSTVA